MSIVTSFFNKTKFYLYKNIKIFFRFYAHDVMKYSTVIILLINKNDFFWKKKAYSVLILQKKNWYCSAEKQCIAIKVKH